MSVRHIRNVYSHGELAESVVKDSFTTAAVGKPYHICATQQLRGYLVKGFLDREKHQGGKRQSEGGKSRVQGGKCTMTGDFASNWEGAHQQQLMPR